MTDTRRFTSPIAGLWRLPDWGLDAQGLVRWAHEVLDMGIDTLDLADIYGGYTVEERFGEALAVDPGLRTRLKLITKCNIKLVNERRPEHTRHVYDSSAEHIVRSLENSLRVLGTDHVELLLLHRQDPLMDPDEVASAFSALKASGKVGAFGVSNFTPSHLAALASRLDEPLVTNQVEVSVLRLDPFEDGTLDQALERGFEPMAWSPLGGGRLFTGDDDRTRRVRAALKEVGDAHGVAEDVVAYAFLLRHPSGIHPITGSGKVERIRAAVTAASVDLSREQWFQVWTASTGESLP